MLQQHLAQGNLFVVGDDNDGGGGDDDGGEMFCRAVILKKYKLNFFYLLI